MRFVEITKREIARVKNFWGRKAHAIAAATFRPNPKLAKPATAKPEVRTYTKWELQNRANKRGERRPIEGALACGLLADLGATETALSAVRASRERLDSLHGRVLDLAPRLRNLCWAIDAAEAANAANAENAEAAAAEAA